MFNVTSRFIGKSIPWPQLDSIYFLILTLFFSCVLRKQILYIFLSNPATEVPPLLSLYYFFKCTRTTQTLLYIEILTIPITPKGNCRRQLNVANAGCMLMYVDTVT